MGEFKEGEEWKRLSETNPELTKIVVGYRKMIDTKRKKPLSFRTISSRITKDHDLNVSHNTVQRILDDVVLMKKEERNRKRRKTLKS